MVGVPLRCFFRRLSVRPRRSPGYAAPSAAGNFGRGNTSVPRTPRIFDRCGLSYRVIDQDGIPRLAWGKGGRQRFN
jgi:hypothetical protein